VLTLLAYGITLWSYGGEKGSLGDYFLTGYASVMLLNAIIPHLAATLVLRRYAPGLITALGLNTPVTLLLLSRALEEEYVSWEPFLMTSAVFLIAILGIIPVLFRVGHHLER